MGRNVEKITVDRQYILARNVGWAKPTIPWIIIMSIYPPLKN